ncbi:hypothetical protein PRZ48_005334 [Zasmidium cellare]|uniref:Uncharacterized protein n=1 Tax=Zasmidium cellare TaxID=395010 RepID=A0ABR0ETM5_ZASCE|nr:hypothetical protein PRZ48_005334 [Zasmidium cellare]
MEISSLLWTNLHACSNGGQRTPEMQRSNQRHPAYIQAKRALHNHIRPPQNLKDLFKATTSALKPRNTTEHNNTYDSNMSASPLTKLVFLYPPLWLDPNATHAAMINPLLPLASTSSIHWLTDFLLAILLCYLIYLPIRLLQGHLTEFTTDLLDIGPDGRSMSRDPRFDFVATSKAITISYVGAISWIVVLGVGTGAMGQYASALFVAGSMLQCGVYLVIAAQMPLSTWVMMRKLERMRKEERVALREASKTD